MIRKLSVIIFLMAIVPMFSAESSAEAELSLLIGVEKYKTIVEHVDKDGKKQGVSVHVYESGEVARIITFKDNEMNGRWMAFYKNGIIGAEGEYDTGKMVGKWKFRNSDGSER